MTDVPPDQDCHRAFCESDVGLEHCAAGRVRALHMDENESLGPYAARYFASKLWYGEQWYMQIDAHMFFRQDWDALSIDMLKKAPSPKPVISHYPPSEYFDFVKKGPITPGERLCGPIFADSDLEAQIIRLEGQGVGSNDCMACKLMHSLSHSNIISSSFVLLHFMHFIVVVFLKKNQ
jgi:hypothetical protein